MGKKKKKNRNYEIWLENLKFQLIVDSLPLEIVSLNKKLEFACNPDTSFEILKILSESKDVRIRYNVASNPNVPVEILEKLLKDVGHGVASNLNAPTEILEKLSRDISDSVRFKVACNPNTPEEVLKILLNDKVWYIKVTSRLK